MYAEGSFIEGLIGRPDGCHAAMTETGLQILMLMRMPTAREIENVKPMRRLELRYCMKYGVMFLAFRTNGGVWNDASYAASVGPTPSAALLAGDTLRVDILLVNTANGQLCAARGHIIKDAVFAKKFYAAIAGMVKRPLNSAEISRAIEMTYNRFTSSKAFAAAFDEKYDSDLPPRTEPRPELRASLRDLASMVRPIPYPGKLPDELRPFHAYLMDGGHCLCAIPRPILAEARASGKLDMYEVPLPVKYVLAKGYEFIDAAHIVVDIKYDETLGAQVEEGDWDEF